MPADAMTLRAATAADAGSIADVFLAARRVAMPYLPTLHAEEETRPWIRDGLVAEDDVHVAIVEGRVAGFAALRASWLEHLYVDPALQGTGIGSALLALVKSLRPDGFALWVFQRNEAARRFYERRGLELVELTDGAGNEEGEPDARYEWRPSPPSGP